MPPDRNSKPATRQLTLTGKPAPPLGNSSTSSRSKPERVYTDAILTIKPEFTQLIATRQKNHEYRKYQLRDGLLRIWFYETTPTSAITYVMETTKPKTPGQVQDPTGIGNEDFDLGLKQSKFGYPVLGLYKLKEPLKPDTMAEFGLTPPQGYMYATKKLIEGRPLEDMEKIF